jgi:hypothetical protein
MGPWALLSYRYIADKFAEANRRSQPKNIARSPVHERNILPVR